VQQTVEESPGEGHHATFVAAAPHAVHDLITSFPGREKIGNQLGRVLQVAVELYRRVAGRERVAREQRWLKAEVLREADHTHPGVGGGDVTQIAAGASGVGVVVEGVPEG